jgi:hypothetical protein
MQNRNDRDAFIRIQWQNIKSGTESNFNKVNPQYTSDFGTPYDYNSIMHYSRKGFSVNGQDTIYVYDAQYRDKIGQREAMSSGDITRLKKMYSC